ncbi:unnamed protein product, partial [Symbiodinium necroappetens]
APTSEFGKRLGPSFRTYWSRTGPDTVELLEGQRLQIYVVEGQMRHVRILNRNGSVGAEASGQVVRNPDADLARKLDVEVVNQDLKACGTFSFRHMLLSSLILLAWHVTRWSISIHCELHAQPDELPWWRGALAMVNGMVFCSWGLFETWAVSLTGERPTYLTNSVGFLLGTALGILGACAQGSDYLLAVLGLAGMFLGGPTLLYYLTQGRHHSRNFFPCAMWTLALLMGTAGGCILLSGIVVLYGLLLQEQVLVATVLLPVATAAVEMGTVMFTKVMYRRLVITKRPAVPGDTSYLPLPFMLISAHSCSEAARLVASFSGAVASGSFSWVGSACITLAMNIFVRLGWNRYLAFRCLRRLSPRLASELAPSGWSKLHDDVKIYAGYFRFIAVVSLVCARAIYYEDISFDGPKAPAFNFSAACSLLALFLLELLEDQVVIRELLPMSPISAEMLDPRTARMNPDFGRLVTMECRPNYEETESPWHLEELNISGERRGSASIVPGKPVELLDQRHSLGERRFSFRSRFRRWLGQERKVIPALTLHGLREMPLPAQLSAMAIACEITVTYLNATLSPGFSRGLCQTPPDFQELVMLWWPVPLQC